MVSRRNFFTITLIMAIMFFLFQSVNTIKERQNNYMVNSYEITDKTLPIKSDAYIDKSFPADNDEVIYIGGNEIDPINNTVTNWCLYSKKTLLTYNSLADYEADKQTQPGIILINPEYLNWENNDDTLKLCEYAENKTIIVFCNLPQTSVISRNTNLKKLLGIRKTESEKINVAGIHLYEGLLLGGEIIYKAETKEDEKRQDMELSFPWYRLLSGTKVYMNGIPEDKSTKTEDYPAVIWRNSYENATIFAVNGNYMEGPEGMGILSGFMTESNSYEIYPVLNSQNMIIANYPGLANENSAEMQRRYSRSINNLFRDIIWPSFESISEKTSFEMTCMIEPQFDYDDENYPVHGNLSYYMKLLNEIGGESGLSAYSVSKTDIKKKLSEDIVFLEEEIPGYNFTSLYVKDSDDTEINKIFDISSFDSLRTIVGSYNGKSDLIGYQNENVTRQNTVIDGFSHTYREDFRVKSIESVLGYTSILVDMERIAYPESDEDSWENLIEYFAAYTSTYWKSFQDFDGTTSAECDKRIRNFLAMNYHDSIKDNVISLEIDGISDTSWFILRTHNQIVENVEGGKFTEIEKNVYLITAEQNDISIVLNSSDERFYYDRKAVRN